MRVWLSRKILPLTLCFAAGVALAGAVERSRPANRPGDAGPPEVSEAHSRTWLIIRSRATLRRPYSPRGPGDLYTAHQRVEFGADGKVSKVYPALGTEKLPAELIVQAYEAMKRIKFTPPTEDGRPLSVVADVVYEVHAACGRGKDMSDNGRCDGGYVYNPTGLRVRIITVEGTKDSEGWRVVYE